MTPPAAMAPTVPVRKAISCQVFHTALDEAADDGDEAALRLVTRFAAAPMVRRKASLDSAAGVAAESAVMTSITLLTFW